MKKSKKEINPLHGLNGQIMVTGAHRYFLGRRSYGPSCCIEWLKLWWKELDQNTKNVIIRDTVEALQDNNAGHECDYERWKQFAEWAWKNGKLSDDDRRWIKQSVEHRKKPWPLTENN